MNVIEDNRLSRKEQFWYEHIRQAKVSNQTLTDYASTHSLSLKCFYNYRSKLRKKGFLKPAATKSFIKAMASTTQDLGTIILLPNGIRIQTQCRAEALPDLIKRLVS